MKRFLNGILLLGLITLASSCGKDWLTELADNPNQPSQAPGTLILPPILSGYAADAIDSYNTLGAWMGYLSYSGGYSITVRTATYWVDQSTPSTTWDNTTWVNWDMLFQIIKNTDYMEKSNATEENMENYVAVAKILKAYGYQRIVDMYGKAPYSEAFQGSKNLFPKYDDGESIYDSCIAELNTAMDIIQNT